VRITDFGIAKMQNSTNLPSKFESSGTPGYMAPEILCKMPYTFTSDFFALGVIVYELIKGHRPYEGKNRQEIR
jgi:p70 ribosomal S6 kinase/serum/glucocorticoid-regulated kinase 2